MRFRMDPEEIGNDTKVKYIFLGAVLTISLQFCWSFFRLTRRNGTTRKPADASSASLSTAAAVAASRTLSPLHHLDFQKLKSRSAGPSRSAEQQGESSIFQIVLTGGPSGGKSR